jgi:AcrR family transcriptional regulator
LENGSDVSQRILSSARRLFVARGFAKTPLRAIAKEAGTSESGVLRIYHSKNGVLRAVYASCWAEINAHIDRALAAAAGDDADPRNLLIQLMKAVLEGYQADPPMNTFMLSHFGFRDTMGLSPDEEIDPAVDAAVKRQYHSYLDRIYGLCDEVAKTWPALDRAGVSSAALGEIVVSVIYGIQTSWYMAEEEQTEPRVGIDEAVTTMKFLLFPEHSRHPDVVLR